MDKYVGCLDNWIGLSLSNTTLLNMGYWILNFDSPNLT